MDPHPIKDLHGITHRPLDGLLVDCLAVIQEGWTFTAGTVTCVECLANSGASLDFAVRVARLVSQKAYIRCRDELKKSVVLRPGDTIDYTHDFNLRCLVEVKDDGSVVIDDPPKKD